MSGLSLETVEHIKQKIIDLSFQFGPKLIVGLAIMTAGFFAARWVGKMVERWLAKMPFEPPVRLLMLRLVRLLVMLLFLLLALQNAGVEILPLIAGLGIAGAGGALGRSEERRGGE